MRVKVGDVRLFFDVEGTKLVAEGPWMRERQTVVLLHPGTRGSTTASSRCRSARGSRPGRRSIYTDLRGAGRSDRSTPAERRVERWADDVKDLCDAVGIERPVVLGIGFGSVVALKYAARHPEHPAALVLAAPIARVVPGTVDRGLRAARRRGRACGRRALLRGHGRAGIRGLPPRLLPAALQLPLTSDVIARADWNPAVLMEWMRGEAKELDLRDELGAIRAPALVLAGEQDAWAPLESVQEVYELLGGHKRFRSYPHARHSVFRDAPEAYEDMRLFLDDIQALETRS